MGESARDFLHQISSLNSVEIKQEKEKEKHSASSDEIELSLGLSLNGCFGVDPSKKTNLIRSSSIASFPSLVTGAEHERPVTSGALMRTTSLPTDEMQVLKRLEAKRKRLERRNSINKNGGKGESSVERCEEDVELKRRKLEVKSEIFNGTTGPVDFASAVAAWKSRGRSSSIDVAGLVDVKPMRGETVSGLSNLSEQRSTEFIEASTNHRAPAAPPIPTNKVSATLNPVRRITGKAHSFSVVERNMLQEMPCVSTKGEGPNGKRVEGFLYKYNKGNEVRIVCVCHGRFLTPAEFVRHAGLGDVAYPLRHIVVNASPSACV